VRIQRRVREGGGQHRGAPTALAVGEVYYCRVTN
jgi:hypothetical protein